jgi:LysR family transcriptional regulator (chromosome initiation inhibitor)
MAAVTAQHVAVQGCRLERLGAMRYVAVGAPSLPGDLGVAPVILYNRKDQLQHRFLASMTRRHADPPVHYVPSASGFVEAIRLGMGWGMVPEQIALPDIAAGAYRRIAEGRHLDVTLYWQYWKIESAVLDALTTAVKAAAASALR